MAVHRGLSHAVNAPLSLMSTMGSLFAPERFLNVITADVLRNVMLVLLRYVLFVLMLKLALFIVTGEIDENVCGKYTELFDPLKSTRSIIVPLLPAPICNHIVDDEG